MLISRFFHEKYDKRNHTCRLFRGPPWLYFEPLKPLNFDFKADPDPAFHSNVDPDHASRYATLPRAVREGTVSQVATVK
jgi:hypothetical protein